MVNGSLLAFCTPPSMYTGLGLTHAAQPFGGAVGCIFASTLKHSMFENVNEYATNDPSKRRSGVGKSNPRTHEKVAAELPQRTMIPGWLSKKKLGAKMSPPSQKEKQSPGLDKTYSYSWA